MSDDITPTTRQPLAGAGPKLDAFRADPESSELYDELHELLRQTNQPAQLAEIAELHAPHIDDPQRAAALFAEAGASRLRLGQSEPGESNLREALARDPLNEAASTRLTEHFIALGRFAEAAAVIEAEIAAIEESVPPDEEAGNGESSNDLMATRRAQRHRQVAALWDGRLGRLDRALHHWQKAWQLEPLRTEALESARAIYASLGKHKMVAQLYEAELEILGDEGEPERRAQLELQLGRMLHRHGESAQAAIHLERALTSDPESEESRESLAEIYSSAGAAPPDAQEARVRAGELFVDLGRRHLDTGDNEGAILFLRRALGVDPFSRGAVESLEVALPSVEGWDELDRLYRQGLASAANDDERREILRKRADLAEHRLGDREELKRCLEQLAALEPAESDCYARLRALYTEDEDWPLLAALIDTAIELMEQDPQGQLRELLELATLTREQLGDRDRAAELLHRALTIDPRNDGALTRYADHFRERRDWRGLADLNEFAIENLREAGAPPADLVRRLEELAHLAELRLGDIDRAITTWQRALELDPQNPRAHESLRRLLSRAKMWESLVGMLEQEAKAAATPAARAEALRRIAQVYRERQVSPRRAIQLYEEILALLPRDEPALKALAELYEREGDDAGLAGTIRRQLELDADKVTAELEQAGKRAAGAREWPVARRVERLTALRRLAGMYEQRLADVDGVVFSCTGVLEILPGDRDALERMERVLDKAGDLTRLEQTLEYHASSATGPAEKAKVLRRLARLAEERGDESAGMDRWEQVLKAVPSDGDALGSLADLYERHGRWGELAGVLERSLMTQKRPEPGSAAAAKRAAELKRYARVVDDKLGDAPRATRAWRKLLEIVQRDRDGLDALARLHEQQGQWRELAEILEKQAPVYREENPHKAAEVALSRARLLEERLGAPADAARALEELIRELNPAHMTAHQSLRRLYEARGDFEAAVRVAERELYLTEEPQRKIARGLEIGLLCRDRLGDPNRALAAFERVLALAPDQEEALGAAAELYAQVGDWQRHVQALERRVGAARDSRELRVLMQRIAQVTAERLGDHRDAFAWYRKAHEQAPDPSTIAELRRAAEAYGLWRELAAVYEDERARLLPAGTDVQVLTAAHDLAASYVAACRELAAVAERRLADPARALDAIRDALRVQPGSDELLAEAERAATEAGRPELWERMLECLDLPLASADRTGRVELLARRARLREERMQDMAGAGTELLTAFSWAPDREDLHQAIEALAERSGAWSDALAVQSALFERAPTLDARIECLRRKAHILEDRMGDRVRAFRVHLASFLLSPEDADTVAHLWRLAREIGRYEEADRTAQPEPPPAHVEPFETPRPRVRRKTGQLLIESSRSRGDATQELTMSDLVETDDVGDRRKAPSDRTPAADRTMTLDLDDLVEIRRPGSEPDPTMELRPEDLIEALGVSRGPRAAPPPPPRTRAGKQARGKGPPPPPPRAPQIKRQPGGTPIVAPGLARRPSLPGVASTILAVPARAYESPWEELATAYEILPARDPAGKLRWLFKASEVWETGAGEIARAFDVLARALSAAPDDCELRARLHRLAEDHGEWDRLAQLYEAAAEAAGTVQRAADLLMDVAEIRAQQERTRDMELLYRRVLGMRPDDPVARERLEALYRAGGRWVDLAASLEERTDPRLGTMVPLAERPTLLRELAALYAEKLSRPHDAIDALERLRALAPEDVEVMEQMASLYGEIGRWSKVIEVLHRVGEAAEGTPAAREALRRIGHIYEVELELPDRAIDAYVQLVAQWPSDAEAYAALDRLYEEHARWKQLEEVLGRRAALSKDPDERVQVLRRQAKIQLGWLRAPEEAAAALRQARTIRPDDGELADELVGALVVADRAREAAALLEGRIAAMRGSSASAGDMAALLIRLAALRADELRDAEGARQALAEATQLVPDHPTALKSMARLATAQKDPRTYADARMREAEVLADVDSKVEALMDAGTTMRDHCADVAGARRAFEKVLELRPYQAEATWALAGLVEQSGDLGLATQVLEARLENASLDPLERAQVLTQLAALSRQVGVDAAAEKRLDEALALLPDHLPAILARADLLAQGVHWNRLIDFIEEAMPRLAGQTPETRAELLRRKAVGFEGLEGSDEAYETLLEADKLHRSNLLVKLALGQNRYQARRWREAALHLGALADHSMAEVYPSEVAEGLCHAALAEIRSMRPEKAEALYERAVALKPNYAPPLQALAEMALERGDARRAADLLTRQATATEDPAERVRLFEALGDMALMTLSDEPRALQCYASAVNAAVPLESRHLPLLEKLLERQDLAGDHAGAGRTAELMASFAAEPEARAARLRSAAQNYMAAGERGRARAAAERAVIADPYDLEVITIASELTMADGDHEATAAMLGRALQAPEVTSQQDDEMTAPLLALLWNRLGDARMHRGDRKGAIAAYQQSVQLAIESDGAMRSRRALLPLWREDADRRDDVIELHRVLAADSLDPADVAAYAQALCRAGNADGGRALLELAAAMGQSLSNDDVKFLAMHQVRVMAEDDPYRGVVDSDARAELIADEDDEPMAAVLATVWEAAALLWADVADAQTRAGMSGARRVPAVSDLPAATIYTRIARALDAPATVLYVTDQSDAPDVTVLCVAPPAVVLGPRLHGHGDAVSDLELRFQLARAAELARPERIVAAGLPPDHLASMCGALVRLFARESGAAAVREEDEFLRRTLPVKVRGQLEKLLAHARGRGLDPDRYRRACLRAADRAGLLVCGDIDTALRLGGVTGPDGSRQLRHLHEMALRRGYLGTRARLGVGALK
ncbi:MAG TPA: tetratricopeptide repeat protein [Kofleriaceae bacterium]|nr:tetratricopeptide repeat protein [Kofleriaceae bacterium]